MRGYGYVKVYSWKSVLKQDLVLVTLSAKNWAQMQYVYLFFIPFKFDAPTMQNKV